jgi:hypothetical protein
MGMVSHPEKLIYIVCEVGSSSNTSSNILLVHIRLYPVHDRTLKVIHFLLLLYL